MRPGSPDHHRLYRALVERDPAYDGRLYACVKTTGVFCRLTCPARKPRPENCQFLDSIAACLEAGFRPCRRCTPLAPAAESDPVVRYLLKELNLDPERRWSEDDLAAQGLDPSTVRRSFRRHFGMTFLEMGRLLRLRNGFETLACGARVIDAQLAAGFDSPSAFRTAFARLLGQPPSAFTGKEPLKAHWIETPLGPMIGVADQSRLQLLKFADQKELPHELTWLRTRTGTQIGIGRCAPLEQIEDELGAYFRGEANAFKVPLSICGSPFQRRVWSALCDIPVGQTRSYGAIAAAIGRPTASRAVARANATNRIALLIPCHRVIGSDGSLTGYGAGLWRKQKLIELEHRLAASALSIRKDP